MLLLCVVICLICVFFLGGGLMFVVGFDLLGCVLGSLFGIWGCGWLLGFSG